MTGWWRGIPPQYLEESFGLLADVEALLYKVKKPLWEDNVIKLR